MSDNSLAVSGYLTGFLLALGLTYFIAKRLNFYCPTDSDMASARMLDLMLRRGMLINGYRILSLIF